MRSITTSDIVLHHLSLLIKKPIDIIRYEVDRKIKCVEKIHCFVILIEDMSTI